MTNTEASISPLEPDWNRLNIPVDDNAEPDDIGPTHTVETDVEED